jgi:hypothetical protein
LPKSHQLLPPARVGVLALVTLSRAAGLMRLASCQLRCISILSQDTPPMCFAYICPPVPPGLLHLQMWQQGCCTVLLTAAVSCNGHPRPHRLLFMCSTLHRTHTLFTQTNILSQPHTTATRCCCMFICRTIFSVRPGLALCSGQPPPLSVSPGLRLGCLLTPLLLQLL